GGGKNRSPSNPPIMLWAALGVDLGQSSTFCAMRKVILCTSNENRDNRAVDFDNNAYKRRSIVECLIGWFKESRRIGTRFEKTAINFGGMVKLAFIHRYLRRCAPC